MNVHSVEIRTVETIIVPLDGSPMAEDALEPARTLADAFGARIELVAATDHRSDANSVQSVEQYLHGLADSLRPFDVGTHHQTGDPDRAILERVHAFPGPLVCMTTRGHTGIGAMLLGSVTERVVRSVSGPILMIGPTFEGASSGFRGNRLVFAFDGSDASAAAIGVAMEWAQRLHLDIRVVMVLHHDGTFLADTDATEGRQRAHELVRRLREEGHCAEVAFLDGIEPARAIAADASHHDVAIVVAASHDHSRLVGSTLGNVTTRLAHHCPCPVLVVRPTPADDTSSEGVHGS